MRGVFNIVFRIISSLLGVLIGLMGCIWILQGLGMASGRMAQSFMENDRMWAVWGVIARAGRRRPGDLEQHAAGHGGLTRR